MSDPDLILAAVELSGLSARQFAERVLSRDERTVRRWSAGQIPIPPIAREWLERWIALSDTRRAAIVRALAS